MSPVQFQIRRSATGFGAANYLPSGAIIIGVNSRPIKRKWELEYRGLVAEEMSTIVDFCTSTEAIVDGFELLDPFANLLAHSEDLTANVWIPSALANVSAVAPSSSDEIRIHTIQNSGMVEQSVRQELGLTGDGTFCASMQVRSDVGSFGRLILSNSAESRAVEFVSGLEWTQVYLSANVSTATAPLAFAIGVAPGCTLLVRNVQLECQPFPSLYKPSSEMGGVFPDARVIHESLEVIQHGPDWFDCSFRIEA